GPGHGEEARRARSRAAREVSASRLRRLTRIARDIQSAPDPVDLDGSRPPCEVTGLAPAQTALRDPDRGLRADRSTRPAARRTAALGILDLALENQQLLAAVALAQRIPRTGRETQELGALATEGVEGERVDARRPGRSEAGAPRVDDDRLPILGL